MRNKPDSGTLDGWADALRWKRNLAHRMVHFRHPDMPGYKDAYAAAFDKETSNEG